MRDREELTREDWTKIRAAELPYRALADNLGPAHPELADVVRTRGAVEGYRTEVRLRGMSPQVGVSDNIVPMPGYYESRLPTPAGVVKDAAETFVDFQTDPTKRQAEIAYPPLDPDYVRPVYRMLGASPPALNYSQLDRERARTVTGPTVYPGIDVVSKIRRYGPHTELSVVASRDRISPPKGR